MNIVLGGKKVLCSRIMVCKLQSAPKSPGELKPQLSSPYPWFLIPYVLCATGE
jgi:hypothetical protein